jgi:molybdate transport system regulatory protein
MTDAPEIELRINLDSETLLGPGKAALLQAIDDTGSIAAAGRRLAMSYKRAWYLIDTMNTYFSEPVVVVSAKGGNSRGGARLTATGRKVLECYRRMEKKTHSALARDLANLAGLATKKQP